MPTTPPEVPTASYRGAGKLMPVQLRARLAVAVAQRGLAEVAKATGCARQTLLRALAGPSVGIRHGTILAIADGVAKIEAAQASTTPESTPPTPPNGGRP